MSPAGSGGCVALQVVPDNCSMSGSTPAVFMVPTAVQAVPDRQEAATSAAPVELAPVGSGAFVAVGAPLLIDSIRPWATPFVSM